VDRHAKDSVAVRAATLSWSAHHLSSMIHPPALGAKPTSFGVTRQERRDLAANHDFAPGRDPAEVLLSGGLGHAGQPEDAWDKREMLIQTHTDPAVQPELHAPADDEPMVT